MKLLLLLLLVLLPFLLNSKPKCKGKGKNHMRAPLYQSPLISSDGLPSTPKAATLKNHYGADPNESPYGPQPKLIKTLVSTVYPDGSVKKENQTEVVHLPDGVFSDCDIARQRYHRLCFNLKTCDLCASNPNCGWCQSTQKCLPGKLKAATCAKACLHSWVFNLKSCRNNVFGKMTNVAPEAFDLIKITPEEPKLKIETVITHPAVVKTPVLLGKIVQKNEIKKVDTRTGEVLNTEKFDYTEPIVGEVQQVMNVDTHHTQYVGLDSGKRLDEDHPKKQLHGKDTFAFKQVFDDSENSNEDGYSEEESLDYSQSN